MLFYTYLDRLTISNVKELKTNTIKKNIYIGFQRSYNYSLFCLIYRYKTELISNMTRYVTNIINHYCHQFKAIFKQML